MRQIDKFESLIDKMIKENSLTKAQLLDAFHKSNPNSLENLSDVSLRFYNYEHYKINTKSK